MPENYCEIHSEKMDKREGQYGVFFSHRTDDPKYPKGWCNGKEPKKGADERQEEVIKALRQVYKAVVENTALLKEVSLMVQNITMTKETPKKETTEDVEPSEIPF